MRPPRRASAWLALALGLGAAASCFRDDFLLGSWCVREEDCGADQCCAGSRCRPQPDHCDRGVGWETPYEYAYMPCDGDDACLVHGMPRCVLWADADTGFCTDFCKDDDPLECEIHPSSMHRTCADVDGQSVCALECAKSRICPADMTCREGLCVPE